MMSARHRFSSDVRQRAWKGRCQPRAWRSRFRIRALSAVVLLGALATLALPAREPAPAPSGRTSVRFAGASHFTGKQLRNAIADQIAEMDQGGVNPAFADDAAFFLGNFYRNHGYASAAVESKVLGVHSVELDIDEGPLTLLSGIEFRGASGLPGRHAQGCRHQSHPGTPAESRKPRFPSSRRTSIPGVDRIRGLYASEGFLDAVVDPARSSRTRNNTRASVVITVHEGIQYHFGQIGFAGDLVFYPNTELLKQLKPFTSKPYTPAQVTNMQRAVVYYYKTHGYYDPKVDVQQQSQDRGRREGAGQFHHRVGRESIDSAGSARKASTAFPSVSCRPASPR